MPSMIAVFTRTPAGPPSPGTPARRDPPYVRRTRLRGTRATFAVLGSAGRALLSSDLASRADVIGVRSDSVERHASNVRVPIGAVVECGGCVADRIHHGA